MTRLWLRSLEQTRQRIGAKLARRAAKATEVPAGALVHEQAARHVDANDWHQDTVVLEAIRASEYRHHPKGGLMKSLQISLSQPSAASSRVSGMPRILTGLVVNAKDQRASTTVGQSCESVGNLASSWGP